MIVWVNGTFGVGKTQVTHELRRRAGCGWVADPELAGFGLQRMQPRTRRRDFQDLAAWREGVVEVLTGLADLDEPVLVPMTLVHHADEVLGQLPDLRHVTLTARPETVRRRLRGRGRVDPFALRHVDPYTAALANERFATHVPTDDRTVDEVVEAVAEIVGVPLVGARSRVGFLRRRIVQVRHIR